MLQTFPAVVIPGESTENIIFDRQQIVVNIWTNSDCPNGAETSAKSVLYLPCLLSVWKKNW